ncbi:hypothetical protein JCM18916_2842 [Cutibacterium acnes JCM 18916]|nr:hypothetical protein JCM18916_2842 [Cutibacterium acnes JCM 18916]
MLTIRRPATYFLALLLAPLVLLSGCGEFNAGFVIRDEDHIDVTVASESSNLALVGMEVVSLKDLPSGFAAVPS